MIVKDQKIKVNGEDLLRIIEDNDGIKEKKLPRKVFKYYPYEKKRNVVRILNILEEKELILVEKKRIFITETGLNYV